MKKLNRIDYIYILLGLLWLSFLIKEAMGNGDFSVFIKAAEIVVSGNSPYNEWIFIDEGNYCQYYYSPLWLTLLIPFNSFPNFIPNIIWLAANTYFLFRIFKLLEKYVSIERGSKSLFLWITVLTILLSARFILYNFQMIQMTLFILWGSLESLRLFQKDKILLGSMLLALIINIKVLPIVLLPYLMYRRFYRSFVATFLFSIVFLFLPSLLLGWSENLFLLSEWWLSINPIKFENLIETQKGVHSLGALIPNLFSEGEGHLPYRRHLFNYSPDTAVLILNLVRISFVLFAIYFLRWPPFIKAKTKLFELREISFLLILIPLIFPRQQKYAFALAIPAMYYLSYYTLSFYRMKKGDPNFKILVAFIIASFLLMTLTTDGVIGKELYEVSQHYKTITYGAIILIFALFIASPQKIVKH